MKKPWSEESQAALHELLDIYTNGRGERGKCPLCIAVTYNCLKCPWIVMTKGRCSQYPVNTMREYACGERNWTIASMPEEEIKVRISHRIFQIKAWIKYWEEH